MIAIDDGQPVLSATATVSVTIENVNDEDPIFEQVKTGPNEQVVLYCRWCYNQDDLKIKACKIEGPHALGNSVMCRMKKGEKRLFVNFLNLRSLSIAFRLII